MKTPRINKHEAKIWLRLNKIIDTTPLSGIEADLYKALTDKFTLIANFAIDSESEIENEALCKLINSELKMSADDPRIEELKEKIDSEKEKSYARAFERLRVSKD